MQLTATLPFPELVARLALTEHFTMFCHRRYFFFLLLVFCLGNITGNILRHVTFGFCFIAFRSFLTPCQARSLLAAQRIQFLCFLSGSKAASLAVTGSHLTQDSETKQALAASSIQVPNMPSFPSWPAIVIHSSHHPSSW